MSTAVKHISPDRIHFSQSLTGSEIGELRSNDRMRVLQTAGPVDSRTWVALNERLFAHRPDVQLRLYGFYQEACDLSFLWAMTNVQRFAADCLISARNVDAIGRLPRLRDLSVGIFELESLRFLEDVPPSLEKLFIGQTRSKRPDLAVLERFGSLRSIYVEGQNKNIEVLEKLQSLEDVTLRSISARDLTFLRRLPKMWSLDIKLGGCKDLSALSGHLGIKYLELWQVLGLHDLGPVSSLPNLQYLYLQSLRQVRALPDLSRLTRLRRIYLENMKNLEDLSALDRAPALAEFIHVGASRHNPDDYLPLLKNTSVRRVRIGFGSDRKNAAFDELARPFGKEKYDFTPFEFSN